MSTSRALMSILVVFSVAVVAGCTQDAATAGNQSSGMTGTPGVDAYPNPITGEDIPNPNPNRIGSWAELPEGREWGSTAGIDIDPTDGHVVGYERCASGSAGGPGVNCDTNSVDPIFKFDRNTGEVLQNFGAGVFVTPHGIHVDSVGNVWVTDFAANEEGTKGHQVHKFSPEGELLMSLGVAGQAGNDSEHLNQPNDVITAPDGSIFVADGHSGQGMTTRDEIEEGRDEGLTGRIIKFSPDGEYITEWGEIGTEHGQFRTPHALAFDSEGRLWVADRGNHRLEIYDQEGNYLDSRYLYGRISDLFITDDQMVYAIDSESNQMQHIGWRNGVRIGPVDQDWLTGFIPPWESDTRPQSGVAGEGVAVDADGNVYVAEGPASLEAAGSAFTKYEVEGM
ncbi:MAG: peptidyl-alpha-hydroxyglycine alpha-amidating lyase family protein [Gemmatimonadota bacterium]